MFRIVRRCRCQNQMPIAISIMACPSRSSSSPAHAPQRSRRDICTRCRRLRLRVLRRWVYCDSDWGPGVLRLHQTDSARPLHRSRGHPRSRRCARMFRRANLRQGFIGRHRVSSQRRRSVCAVGRLCLGFLPELLPRPGRRRLRHRVIGGRGPLGCEGTSGRSALRRSQAIAATSIQAHIRSP